MSNVQKIVSGYADFEQGIKSLFDYIIPDHCGFKDLRDATYEALVVGSLLTVRHSEGYLASHDTIRTMKQSDCGNYTLVVGTAWDEDKETLYLLSNRNEVDKL